MEEDISDGVRRKREMWAKKEREMAVERQKEKVAKQALASGATFGGAGGVGSAAKARPSAAFDISKQDCHYGQECKKASCPRRHPASRPAPVPEEEQDCQFGLRCKREDCRRIHPEPVPIEETECFYGHNCRKQDCKRIHPVRTPIEEQVCYYGANCKKEDCARRHPALEDTNWRSGGAGQTGQSLRSRRALCPNSSHCPGQRALRDREGADPPCRLEHPRDDRLGTCMTCHHICTFEAGPILEKSPCPWMNRAKPKQEPACKSHPGSPPGVVRSEGDKEGEESDYDDDEVM